MLVKRYKKKTLIFKLSDRFLWIFYFILFNNLEFNIKNRFLTNKEILNLKKYIKNFINLKKYISFFNELDLNVSVYYNNYTSSGLFSTLFYYLYSLPKNFYQKKICNFYFYNFKVFLNILNLYFIPNHVYKVLDVFFLKKISLN